MKLPPSTPIRKGVGGGSTTGNIGESSFFIIADAAPAGGESSRNKFLRLCFYPNCQESEDGERGRGGEGRFLI